MELLALLNKRSDHFPFTVFPDRVGWFILICKEYAAVYSGIIVMLYKKCPSPKLCYFVG